MANNVLAWRGVQPHIHGSAFVAPTATVIGNTTIGQDSSIWFGTVVRGDVHEIRIGARTNIQDNSVVHVTGGKYGTYIGSDITIGHRAIIHACTLEDGCFIGMGAVVMDGAVVESCAMVAANAMITPGKRVKAGELWAGSPARSLRPLSAEEINGFSLVTSKYIDLHREYQTLLGMV
ncbi:carbonic anhydrase, family 3 [invertebrate metagenome]|uniref:Carbonic anhydrase, family 3 n=1 Tax=invertebrate metagenome TaxID=1711999 RepID=A0A484HAW5_9ZZZZ